MRLVKMNQKFHNLCAEVCTIVYYSDFPVSKLIPLLDDLNSFDFKSDLFDHKDETTKLITALCSNITPSEESLSVKTSHLLANILNIQNIQIENKILINIITWHIQCIKQCSCTVLADILYNLQKIIQHQPISFSKFPDELLGENSVLLDMLENVKAINQDPTYSLNISLLCMKCLCFLTSIPEENKNIEQPNVNEKILKERISKVVLKQLYKNILKGQDECKFCKIQIYGLRVLAQIYFGHSDIIIPLPDVMGVCTYYMLYGINSMYSHPQKINPAQQSIAVPIVRNSKGGKKQKVRKQKNNIVENLKKELPTSDRVMMNDVQNFENCLPYIPAIHSYLELPKSSSTTWLTSDSDVSDVENKKNVRLVALKSHVRQGAFNLLLVLIKITEKKDMFGYWWALLPDSADANSGDLVDSKRTLANCVINDPIAVNRVAALNVILALLTGSRVYLSQAETSKKETTSFIPFSVTLGYTITCLHRVLIDILDKEKTKVVLLAALKCCAALVQATPYHKMREGIITDLVRSLRKFLVHRDVTLQVGALITMGCVISVDPKVEEVLKAIEKDNVSSNFLVNNCKEKLNKDEQYNDDCVDFEEGYSDDELFVVKDNSLLTTGVKKLYCFNSWILDICFRNMGWTFRDDKIVKCNPSAVPVIMESLQVVSALSFHHFPALLEQHLLLLTDILCDMLQSDYQEVVTQAVKTSSVLGDALQKLEQNESPPQLNSCVYFWDKVLPLLSNVLQCHDNPSAKAVVCECIANIGERVFNEISRRQQVLCCALLVGSCSDEDAVVRAEAVRALAMTVMYRTLREDICYVSDCAENILRALAKLTESTLVVRTKAAWALGNMSDALVLNMKDPDIEDVDGDLLLRLLETSIHCSMENDKIKMSATRGLGNLLRILKEEHLCKNPQIKKLSESALEKLLHCSCKVVNMKVRWNACHALGNAMKNDNIFTCLTGWQSQVFPSLCLLAQDCKNLKVRINAVVALRAPSNRSQYAEFFAPVWRAIMAAMEKALNIDDFTEYKHKDHLFEQLCVTLSYLCCKLNTTDLTDIYDPLCFHYDCAKALFDQLSRRLPPENTSCLQILEAAKYVTVDLITETETQRQVLGMLQEIFIWDV